MRWEITSDERHLVSSVPNFSHHGYAVVMKTVPNTLKFEVSEPARFRLTVVEHAETFGWQSACHAYHISRATVFRWRKRMDGRLISLIPTSTKPHRTRRMVVDDRLLTFLRAIRDTYGNIGKEKLVPLLTAYAVSLGIPAYGATKIGKIVHRYRLTTPISRRTMRRRKPAMLRRKYAPKGVLHGHCEMDGITVYFDGETHRFVSIIDVVTRQAWCQWVPSFAAKHTVATLKDFQQRTPVQIHTIQTDNGSEFLGSFHAYLEQQGVRHEFSYPRCPRINGMVERFNRTMQEECINRIIDFVDDRKTFLNKLEQYCVWYNTKRPHYALKYQTPQAYAETLTGGQ